MKLFKRSNGLKIAGLLYDPHHPFVDERAYKLCLGVFKDLGIDELVVGGDFADFFAVMAHKKDPSIKIDFEEEVKVVNKELDKLDKLFPNIKKVFIEGNHEYRLFRYIRDKCPELFGLFDWQELLHFKPYRQKARKNWEVVPYGPYQKYSVLGSKLIARHEPMAGGKYAAAQTVTKAGTSVIFGHTHQIQEHQIVMLDGQNHRGINAGWLGNKDKYPQVFNYVKNHHQWALAFTVVYVLPDGTFHAKVIHIIDYKCVVNGKLYTG